MDLVIFRLHFIDIFHFYSVMLLFVYEGKVAVSLVPTKFLQIKISIFAKIWWLLKTRPRVLYVYKVKALFHVP